MSRYLANKTEKVRNWCPPIAYEYPESEIVAHSVTSAPLSGAHAKSQPREYCQAARAAQYDLVQLLIMLHGAPQS